MKTTALNEFKNLKENDLYSLAKVEWWLMKYEGYYNDLKSYWCCDRCNLMSAVGTCSCKYPYDEYVFLELFKDLDVFCQYRRYESYFQGELETYYKVKDDPKTLKNLIIKNGQIGADECFEFLIDYHNYSLNPVHLYVYSSSFKDFDIYIDRIDFENTITFLGIFSKLFWEDEIYPESEILLRIKNELAECRSDVRIQ
jgi:hypothetical protein